MPLAVALFLLLTLAVPARAADAPVAASASVTGAVVRLDEARAVELALQNTLSIKLSLLRRDTDRASYRVARHQFVPTLALTSSVGRRQSRTQTLDGDPLEQRETDTLEVAPAISWQIPTGGAFSYAWGNRFTESRSALDHLTTSGTPAWGVGWTLSFSQPLLRGGGIAMGTAGYRQARIGEQLSQLGFRVAAISAINEVLGTLRGFVQAREAEAIAAHSMERGQQLLEINRDLLKTGRISRSEVTQAQAEMAGRELGLTTARNAADSARLRLARLLDLPPDAQFAIDLPAKIEPVTSTLPRALDLAWRERPDWIASLLANDAAAIGLAVARNGQLWDLRLDASHGRASLHGATSSYSSAYRGLLRPDAEENFMGLTLVVPLWDNHARRQNIVAARNAHRERELVHENLRQNIESEVIDQLRNLDVAWKSLELARTARGFAETAVQDEATRLSSGLTSTLNVTRLEDSLVSAQNAELAAVIGYLNAVSAFDTTLGTTLTTWRVQLDAGRGDPPRVSP